MVKKTIDEILFESDIITLHLPGSNKPIISNKQMKKIKHGAYLVNIARGGLIDEKVLYNALINNKLSGAAIDVFVEEPYNGPLSKLDNIILTPHIGSYAKESKIKMELDAVNNLIKNI